MLPVNVYEKNRGEAKPGFAPISWFALGSAFS